MSQDSSDAHTPATGPQRDGVPQAIRALLMLVGAQEVLLEVAAAVAQRPEDEERGEAFDVAAAQVETLRVLVQRELSADAYRANARPGAGPGAGDASSWSGEEHTLNEWVRRAFEGPDLHDAVPSYAQDGPDELVGAYCAAPLTREDYGCEHAA